MQVRSILHTPPFSTDPPRPELRRQLTPNVHEMPTFAILMHSEKSRRAERQETPSKRQEKWVALSEREIQTIV